MTMKPRKPVKWLDRFFDVTDMGLTPEMNAKPIFRKIETPNILKKDERPDQHTR